MYSSASHLPPVLARIVVAILGLVPAILVVGVIRTQAANGFDPLGAIVGSFLATISAICFWLAFGGGSPAALRIFRCAILGGGILGSLGFVVGFFGPILFNPGANQGPLLGIFVTGPGGFVIGTILGGIIGLTRSRRLDNPESRKR